jgi:hypothetical protein
LELPLKASITEGVVGEYLGGDAVFPYIGTNRDQSIGLNAILDDIMFFNGILSQDHINGIYHSWAWPEYNGE